MNTRVALLPLIAIVVACSSAPVPSSTPAPSPAPVPAAPAPTPTRVARMTATATIRDVAGGRVGTITFTDSYAGVLVQGTLTGLGLGGHGIHIHETGKCEAPFTTAGGHFNPAHRKHGFMSPDGAHLGDMSNVESPAAGQARFEFLLPDVTLKGKNALLDADGAAIVIHSARDDYSTDPSGNSGGRIACGVITAS